jgi:hypothetical protein
VSKNDTYQGEGLPGRIVMLFIWLNFAVLVALSGLMWVHDLMRFAGVDIFMHN